MIKYVLINERERNRFEKEHFIPFGYSNQEHCYVLGSDYLKAISLWHRIEGNKDWIIEKHENGIRDIVFPKEV